MIKVDRKNVYLLANYSRNMVSTYRIQELVSDDMEIKKLNQYFEILINSNDRKDKTNWVVSAGNAIGWFQGRMEWGPRALGNRSILCDPRRSDMKDILNKNFGSEDKSKETAGKLIKDTAKKDVEKVQSGRTVKKKINPNVSKGSGDGVTGIAPAKGFSLTGIAPA